jgi:hypothetical protein
VISAVSPGRSGMLRLRSPSTLGAWRSECSTPKKRVPQGRFETSASPFGPAATFQVPSRKMFANPESQKTLGQQETVAPLF